MPQSSKNLHRAEAPIARNHLHGKASGTKVDIPDINDAQTEEHKIAAMFKIGADQWAQQQQEMAK